SSSAPPRKPRRPAPCRGRWREPRSAYRPNSARPSRRGGDGHREMSTILITGANKGLGREAARRLLAEGHEVWLAARDPERGREAARELGGRFVALDVTSERSVEAAAEHVAAESGALDVLINNAGIVGRRVPVAEVTAEDVRRVF